MLLLLQLRLPALLSIHFTKAPPWQQQQQPNRHNALRTVCSASTDLCALQHSIYTTYSIQRGGSAQLQPLARSAAILQASMLLRLWYLPWPAAAAHPHTRAAEHQRHCAKPTQMLWQLQRDKRTVQDRMLRSYIRPAQSRAQTTSRINRLVYATQAKQPTQAADTQTLCSLAGVCSLTVQLHVQCSAACRTAAI